MADKSYDIQNAVETAILKGLEPLRDEKGNTIGYSKDFVKVALDYLKQFPPAAGSGSVRRGPPKGVLESFAKDLGVQTETSGTA